MNDVVIFLPETGIHPYLRTLSAIAASLSDNISLIHCTGQMEICNMIPSADTDVLSENKRIACRKCHKTFCSAKQNFLINVIELSDIITAEKINKLKQVIPDSFEECLKYSYKSVPVGIFAEYDLVLKTKFLRVENITDKQKELYYKYLLNAIIATEIADYICRINKPKSILVFNPYTVNQVVGYIAKKNNINFHYITDNSYMGADGSSFMITKQLITMDYLNVLADFKKCENYPILPSYVKRSWLDSFFRFYGSDGHIFSNSKTQTPASIIESLRIQKNKKTIIAFTSSNDELICAKLAYQVNQKPFPMRNIFLTQIEWIQFLSTYANLHKDIQIIVRVHPREGSRQNGIPSEHLQLLQKTFCGNDHTDNFVIIWADNPISSYDLIELADLCLVNWSTMGQECARVGIPVLSYTSDYYYYNSKCFFVSKNIEEYSNTLDKLLKSEYSLEMLQTAIRYNYWRNIIMAVDCSDSIAHDYTNEEYWPVLSSEKQRVFNNICFGNLDIVEYNKKKWFSRITEKSEKEEIQEILKGISNFYYKVFINPNPSKLQIFTFRCLRKFMFIISFKKKLLDRLNYIKTRFPRAMFYSEMMPKRHSFIHYKQPCFILEKENIVIYIYKGNVYKRYSPLLWKLGKIYKDNSNFIR